MAAGTSRAADLLALVHARPGITRVDAARALGIGTGPAADLVARLGRAGLLTEHAVPPIGRGRPTTSLHAHPGGPLVLAISLTADRWHLGLTELGGGIGQRRTGRHSGRTGQQVCATVAEAADELRATVGSRIRGCAVSAPGVVIDGRLVIASQLGWADVDLRGLGRPGEVFVADNDATLAGAAESYRGRAVGAAVAVHIRIDNGIGGALVLGGRPMLGATGTAAEFGHMPFGDRTLRCSCRAWGCWGMATDGTAMARALGDPEPGDPVEYFGSVCARARAGDRSALAAVHAVADSLGHGIGALVNGLDADLVTVGGLGVQLLDLAPDLVHRAYLDALQVNRRALPVPVLAAQCGDDGPLIGAAERAWTQLWGPLVADSVQDQRMSRAQAAGQQPDG